MSSDFVVGMELVADNCVLKWRQLIGPTNCHVARVEAPNSLRALYGTEGVRNACHGSDSRKKIIFFLKVNAFLLKAGSAQRECDFFFSEKTKLKVNS